MMKDTKKNTYTKLTQRRGRHRVATRHLHSNAFPRDSPMRPPFAGCFIYIQIYLGCMMKDTKKNTYTKLTQCRVEKHATEWPHGIYTPMPWPASPSPATAR